MEGEKVNRFTKILIGLGSIGLISYIFFKLIRPSKSEILPTLTVEDFVVQVAKKYNPTISNNIAKEIAESVVKWTGKRNLNLFSVLAIIAQESHFRPTPTGTAGEKGLMQLSPTALDELERVYKIKINREKIYDIDYNIELGTLFYKYCIYLTNKYRSLPEESFRFEAIARYNKTFAPERAKSYAREVMSKRSEIVNLYNKIFTK